MTPRTAALAARRARDAALAFRIWQHAGSVSWDCTVHDLTAELFRFPDKEAVKAVRRICREKGWTERLRVTEASATYAPWLHSEQMETARHVRRTIAGDW